MRKYIGPVKSNNFAYPNNVLEEYDVEIIHDINNNSVSGTTAGFSAVYSGGSIACSFTYIWSKNGAEPFINEFGSLSVLSIHMTAPGQDYYKPFRTVASVAVTGITATTVTDTFLFFVSPAQMGVSGFTSGVYNFEIRFIGQKAVYPICESASVIVPTLTPTPTPTLGTPTPTPTGGPTFTPTPTPTPSGPCVCVEINVTGTTGGPEPTYANIEYNNCFGVLTAEIFTTNGIRYRCMDYTGAVIQVFSSNGLTYGIASGLSCYDGTCPTDIVVTQTPTPTPTPTATSVGPTATPTVTPTPTATPEGPTATPTPTPTATSVGPTATPTPTPTATDVPPTATPTPTATSVPFYTYYIGQSNSSSANACSNFDAEPQTEVYADTNSPLAVTRFYTDTNLITPFIGSGNWYAWRLGLSGPASHSGQVSSGGFVTNTTTC